MDLTARRNARLDEEEQQLSESLASEVLAEEYESLWGSSETKIRQINTDEIRTYKSPRGKAQPYFVNAKKVKALQLSLQDNGMLQPIVVRPLHHDEFYEYEVVIGNSRFAAASNLEWNSVPCVVQEMTDDEAYDKVCQSNIHRHYDTLAPSELANLYQGYLDNRGDNDDTVRFIAERFGTSPRSIYRYVSLLKLPTSLIQAVDEKLLPFGKFERMLQAFTYRQLEVIGEYIQYYRCKINRNTIAKLEILADQGYSFSMDDITDLHERLERLDIEKAPVTTDKPEEYSVKLFATLRELHSEKFSELSDAEMEEYIIRLVAAYI